jgi:hypothetical protein
MLYLATPDKGIVIVHWGDVGGFCVMFPDQETFNAWAEDGRTYAPEYAAIALDGNHAEELIGPVGAKVIKKLKDRRIPIMVVFREAGQTGGRTRFEMRPADLQEMASA